MKIGTKPARARDDGARRDATAFEIEIERAWTRLTSKPTALYLTPGRLLVRQRGNGGIPFAAVGTYTKAVALQAFREDCFFVLEAMR